MKKLFLVLSLFSITVYAANTFYQPIVANSTVTLNQYTASRAVVLNASKGLSTSSVTDTELTFLSGLAGVVPLTKGGTGQVTADASLNALLPSQTGNSGEFLTTNGSTTAWAAVSGGAGTDPLITSYTTVGSGAHTLTGSPIYIRVRMVGAGGGGAGSSTQSAANGGNGGDGGTTTFGTSLLVAAGGNGSDFNTGAHTAGGTISLGGSPGIGRQGATSRSYGYTIADSATKYPPGTDGAGTPFGDGGGGGITGAAGANAIANTGAGGGGGGGPGSGINGSISGGGGAAGGFIDALILSPGSTSAYAVGAGGDAGSAGTSGAAGGTGAAGFIEVTEYY